MINITFEQAIEACSQAIIYGRLQALAKDENGDWLYIGGCSYLTPTGYCCGIGASFDLPEPPEWNDEPFDVLANSKAWDAVTCPPEDFAVLNELQMFHDEIVTDNPVTRQRALGEFADFLERNGAHPKAVKIVRSHIQ